MLPYLLRPNTKLQASYSQVITSGNLDSYPPQTVAGACLPPSLVSVFHHFILRSFRLSYLAKDDRVPNALAPGYTVIIIITGVKRTTFDAFGKDHT